MHTNAVSLRVNLLLIVCLQVASPQMNDGKNDQNYIDLSEVTFDDNVSDQEDDSSMSYLEEKGLCVPQDRLEDLDFFPNFDDDWIRLDHVMESDFDVGCNKEDSGKVNLCSNSRDDHGEVSSFHYRDLSSARETDVGCNEEDSGKFLCSNSCDDHGEISSSHYRDLSSAKETEEIEGKVTTKSDACFGQDVQEHKLRGDTLYLDYDDDRVSSISVKQEDAWKGKKARTKVLRKENRNLLIPVLKSRKMKRCSHCQAGETPQWRTGPAGRKSLCNACGLRFKVGRMVSNYRPAASPSFDSTKHSNFYRMLMRNKIKIENGRPI